MNILKKGKYVIADPKFALPERLLDETMNLILGNDYFYDDVIERDGLGYIIYQTWHGNGVYECNDGESFPVELGLIGVYPVEICCAEKLGFLLEDESGVVIEVDEPLVCTSINGTLTFGNVVIQTGAYD